MAIFTWRVILPSFQAWFDDAELSRRLASE